VYRTIVAAGDRAEPTAALSTAIALCDADAQVTLAPGGRTADQLRDIAVAHAADLIVLAPSLRHGARPAVLQLAQDAPCALAVAGATPGPNLGPGDRIGVAYDGSAESELALSTARAIAGETGARLVLIGATEAGGDPAATCRVLCAAVDRAGDVRCDTRTLRGVPGPAILAAGDDLALLVAGSRHLGPPGRVLTGSVSGLLLARSATPVLVTPRPAARPARRFAPARRLIAAGVLAR
jgi:nucleotide-binding universal stress UspA family protein